MSLDSVVQDFQNKVSTKIRIEPEGIRRYQVFTPFRFEDGDHLVVVLKQDDSGWKLTDEAHTFMRLTYDIEAKELEKGTRQKIISNALSEFMVENHNGEFVHKIQNEQFGDSLYSFIQAILKVSNVSFLTRERIRSTFKEDFQAFFTEKVSSKLTDFNWSDSKNDPAGNYKIDCRINNVSRPIFVQALTNDDATRDATITLLNFEKWRIPFKSLAIFEDQERISRKVLARFTDVSGKQFSSLEANKERISHFLSDNIKD